MLTADGARELMGGYTVNQDELYVEQRMTTILNVVRRAAREHTSYCTIDMRKESFKHSRSIVKKLRELGYTVRMNLFYETITIQW